MENNIYCVSLGPGDPELITLKALRCLQGADLIFCPGTSAEESRARDILLELEIDSEIIKLFCVPMSIDRTRAKEVYEEVSRQILSFSRSGKQVAFVAEGDSGFYSSVQYIGDHLAEMGIPVTHIAGVPAFIACGALARLHIVKQNEELLVIPADASVHELRECLAAKRTIVLMKLPRQRTVINGLLKELPTIEMHYFENVGIEEKEFYTTDKSVILKRDLPYFSLLIIRNN